MAGGGEDDVHETPPESVVLTVLRARTRHGLTGGAYKTLPLTPVSLLTTPPSSLPTSQRRSFYVRIRIHPTPRSASSLPSALNAVLLQVVGAARCPPSVAPSPASFPPTASPETSLKTLLALANSLHRPRPSQTATSLPSTPSHTMSKINTAITQMFGIKHPILLAGSLS